MITNQAGSEGLLVVIANAKAKLGIIFLDIKRASEELSRLI
jgi:uncharacterized protein